MMTVTKLTLWSVVIVAVTIVQEMACLNGPNVCMVQQKYNITKRVKYRAPMSVRTYEWCFSMPPRCSKWKTEMRELTKLETDERIAEVAVCCPGYKMKDVSCVPICPNGKTGHRCSEDCPENKWGPNCVNECESCYSGICSPITGDCSCQDGWQGESCEIRMLPTTSTTMTVRELLTKPATKPTLPIATTIASTRPVLVVTTPLATTPHRTTMIENTTHHIRPNTISETPIISNRTVNLRNPFVANRTTLSEAPSLVPIKEEETTVETSRAVTTNTTAPTTTRITKNPVTTTLRARVTSETTVATVAPVKMATKPVTSIPITEGKPIEDITITSKTTTTSTTVHTQGSIEKIDKNNMTTTTETAKITTSINYIIVSNDTIEIHKPVEHTTRRMLVDSKYNRTEIPVVPKINIKEQHIPVHITADTNDKLGVTFTSFQPKTLIVDNVTDVPVVTTLQKVETTKRPESTIRYFPTTVKFKPKEIWIRPAQKGESYKSKSEASQDYHSKPRVTQPNTTPKTIIVSIIPTSVSYASFKKIALTTASLFYKMNTTVASPNGTADRGVTKPMSTLTSTESPVTTKLNNDNVIQKNLISSKLNITKELQLSKSEQRIDRVTKTFSPIHTTRESSKNMTVFKNETNSMTTVDKNLNSSNSITTPSTNAIRTTRQNITLEMTTVKPNVTKFDIVTRPIKIVTVKPRNVTIITVSGKNKNETIVKITKTTARDIEKTNATRIKDFIKTNQVTTESPDGEEFHILTEPEHITAVMEGKGKERTSVDLVSVISIAGGIMMAVITVAVIIVMVERCKRPRYDNVRKISDIRMQVMTDHNDEPPPYVRSIFHTPLPDPPNSEKCHYQPISTLDRNLKQFMRPVVVQTISPIMLENFRGILECHYDHLPRRSNHFDASQRHCSIVPSMDEVDELTHLRPCNAVDSTIEALKCEARLDVIDSTTSEPLYAEIPCWRPPSEHAVEIMNLNGEAVTEL